jgi:3-deoxy-manno-octulosonate cytidylyltransferase (CMP-KDO synthetase)
MPGSKHVSAVAIIPARLASERFPRKVLADATGKPMIVHVAQATAQAETVQRVVIAADCEEIADAAKPSGVEVVLTDPSHPNGTSRVAEAAAILGIDESTLVVNVQGDEPEIEASTIDAAVHALADRDTPVATVAARFADDEDPSNPNIVKVVCNEMGEALYFSRAPIPFGRGTTPDYYKHIGLYVYRRSFLDLVGSLTETRLEQAEKLEQLRFLEHGYSIAVAPVTASHVGIDTKEQYEAFVQRWQSRAGGTHA